MPIVAKWPRVLLAACVLAAPSLGAGCSGGEAGAAGEVVLYTSIPAELGERLEGVIEQRFPDMKGDYWVPMDVEGISLRVVRGRTADIQARIEADLAAGGINADLIWLAEPSPYEDYSGRGLLAGYRLPAQTPIPPEYVDPDGHYVAARVISMVVAWNTDLVPAGLTDWPDLMETTSAAFPAPQSGAARATIKGLMDEFGPDFFQDFSDGGGTSVSSNGAVRTALVAGRYEAGGVLDYMVRDAKAAGSPIDYAYPASGTVVIPSPIAITANAPNPEAARAVVDYILSASGQEIIVEIGGFYPARTDVAPPAGAPPLGEVPAIPVDWETLADEVEAISAYWEELYGPDE